MGGELGGLNRWGRELYRPARRVGGFLGESKGWDSEQREEGDSTGESKGWNSL